MNRGKSSGLDTVINEYLLETMDIIAEHVTRMFNAVLNSQKFPSQWSSGIIIPIHKKGPTNDPNNYRGITLASCLGKLFTIVVNERLKMWATEHEVSTDAQFGFKANHSTVDAVFILDSIINKYLQSRK